MSKGNGPGIVCYRNYTTKVFPNFMGTKVCEMIAITQKKAVFEKEENNQNMFRTTHVRLKIKSRRNALKHLMVTLGNFQQIGQEMLVKDGNLPKVQTQGETRCRPGADPVQTQGGPGAKQDENGYIR